MEENKPTPENDPTSPSDLGRQLSLFGASKGGKARAKSLTPEQRSKAARLAVEARWARQGIAPVPKATHSGEIKIGDVLIPCAVLDDGTRVLTQRGFSVALGRYKNPNKKGAIVELPVFLTANNLKEFITEDLERSATEIRFRMAEGSGGLEGNIALGYRATLLQEVCNVYLKAQHAGKLLKRQEHIAKRSLILLNGLATVGIIALVDEATGYQADRARDALAKILEAFIAKELRPYVRTFEPEFYKELFRLQGIEFKGTVKAPRYIGKLTNDLIYDRLAPGVREELNRINPNNERGQRKHKNFQWLTQNFGYQKLKQHLAAVTVLMKVFDDWNTFKKSLDKALPRQDEMPLFDHSKEEATKVIG
jgi:hypothetical protein